MSKTETRNSPPTILPPPTRKAEPLPTAIAVPCDHLGPMLYHARSAPVDPERAEHWRAHGIRAVVYLREDIAQATAAECARLAALDASEGALAPTEPAPPPEVAEDEAGVDWHAFAVEMVAAIAAAERDTSRRLSFDDFAANTAATHVFRAIRERIEEAADEEGVDIAELREAANFGVENA